MHLCIYASIHLCIHASMHPSIYASMHKQVFGSNNEPKKRHPITQLQLALRPCIQRVLNDSSPYPQKHGKKRLHKDLLANTGRRCKCLPKSTKILLLLPRLLYRASWHPAQSTHSTQGARNEFLWTSLDLFQRAGRLLWVLSHGQGRTHLHVFRFQTLHEHVAICWRGFHTPRPAIEWCIKLLATGTSN